MCLSLCWNVDVVTVLSTANKIIAYIDNIKHRYGCL